MIKSILELKFEEEIRDKMFLAKKECKYNPTRFHQMINNRWIYYALSLRQIGLNNGKFCL